MKNTVSMWQSNSWVVFWLGLLTGAIIVGIVAFYNAINAVNYQTSLFKYKLDTGGLTGVNSGLSTDLSTSTNTDLTSIDDPNVMLGK